MHLPLITPCVLAFGTATSSAHFPRLLHHTATVFQLPHGVGTFCATGSALGASDVVECEGGYVFASNSRRSLTKVTVAESAVAESVDWEWAAAADGAAPLLAEVPAMTAVSTGALIVRDRTQVVVFTDRSAPV